MAHFAELDENNKVINVIVVNNDAIDLDNEEESGLDFLESLFNHRRWKRTSYNTFEGTHVQNKTPFRTNYAGIGMVYDEDKDMFYVPKPVEFPSFIFDETRGIWEPPVPHPDPDDNEGYVWDEKTVNWKIRIK
jgi:hypothetical protein